MTQTELLFQHHSDTSREAAESMETCAHTLRAKVYAFIKMHSLGATDDEIQGALGMAGSTQRPRRVELQKMGLIVDSGRKRETRTGRNAVVWIAV